MLGRFLSDKDYKQLISCASISEAVSFLKNHTDYGQTMSAAGGNLTVDGVEHLLRRRLLQRFERVSKYEMSVGDKFYRYFLVQSDIERIIEQMRRIRSGTTGSDDYEIPAFFAAHTEIDVDALFKTDSIHQMIRLLRKTPYAEVLEPYSDGGDPLAAETALMKYGSECIESFAGKKKSVLQLLGMRADMRNLTTLYRCIGFRFDAERTKQYLYTQHSGLNKKQWDMLMSAETCDKLVKLIKNTPYGKNFEFDGYFESAVDKMLYKKMYRGVRFCTDPSAVLVCFVFLAENEVKNIVHIIEGIKYNISAEEISKVLVGVK